MLYLKKELKRLENKNDINRIKDLAVKAKELARNLAESSGDLLHNQEIYGEDLHKLLLAIQNLIEYLNRVYFKDDNIEEEVEGMTRTLYDPEVEKKGRLEGKLEVAKNLLDVLDDETIALKTELDIEVVKKLRTENKIEQLR